MNRTATPERTRASRSVARPRILEAARAMFAAEGFERTTIRAIAARCGLSDAAVLYHFRSKHALLSALLVEPDVPPFEAAARGDVEGVLDQLLAGFFTWVENADLVRVVLTEALGTRTSAGAFREQSIRTFHQSLRPVLEQLEPAGCDEMCEALTAILSGAMIDGLMRWGPRFPQVARDPAFGAQLRRQCALVLPAATGAATTTA